MNSQNGTYDQASIAQAVGALLFGECVRIRCTDERERRRLRQTFRRYATRLGFAAEIHAEENVLIVRWIKAGSTE